MKLRWAVLAVVLLADVMDLVDGTIVNVAAPSISADLGGGSSTMQWLVAAYGLAFAVLQSIVTGAVFDPYAPEAQRRQQIADLRDRFERKAG